MISHLYPGYLILIIYFVSKLDREHSQTRGKSKEHVQNYLGEIFFDRKFDSTSRISEPSVKEARSKALADLWINDRFIWELPVYQKNEQGEVVNGLDGKPVFLQKPRDPFTGPYIRNALRVLFLEDYGEWKTFPKDHFTIPQIAFVVTLVYLIISVYF